MAATAQKLNINVPARAMVIFGLGAAFFFLVGLRLWYLQVVRGEEYREKSENNRIRTVSVPPARGAILDREGKVLVKNRASFNIEFVPEDSPDPKASVATLSEIVGIPFDDLWERTKDSRKRRRFEPKILLRDVSRDVLAQVSAKRWQLPGIIINVVPAREYVYGQLGAHALGYIREITSTQLERAEYGGYQRGDVVGQFGLEKKWEKFLQGKRGLQQVVVDATGSRIGESSFEKDIAGHSLTLTIDLDVQKAAEEALGQRKGAVVALDAKTGEVLALVSHPAFDPNIFAGEISPTVWKDLTTGKEKKLNNRATQGVFPPGSVFKVFMAVAGLSESAVSPETRVSCPGFLPFGGRSFRCHKSSGHGPVDLFQAVVMSCDVYFYTLGNRLGIDRIHDYASRFGLGSKTGLALGEEAAGIIPSTAWKKAYFKNPANQKWFPGETLSVVIGQGATTVTPMQIARATAALSNGGHLLTPYLVKKIESVDGSFKDDNFHPNQTEVDVKPDVLARVKAAMEGVVHDPRGTGHRASLEKEFGIKAGGKTGTAQVASLEFHKEGTDLDHHAWYSGFAPVEDPQIVVTALVENGGHGGATAAPVVKQTMEAFFDKRLTRLLPKGSTEGLKKASSSSPLPEATNSNALVGLDEVVPQEEAIVEGHEGEPVEGANLAD